MECKLWISTCKTYGVRASNDVNWYSYIWIQWRYANLHHLKMCDPSCFLSIFSHPMHGLTFQVTPALSYKVRSKSYPWFTPVCLQRLKYYQIWAGQMLVIYIGFQFSSSLHLSDNILLLNCLLFRDLHWLCHSFDNSLFSIALWMIVSTTVTAKSCNTSAP